MVYIIQLNTVKYAVDHQQAVECFFEHKLPQLVFEKTFNSLLMIHCVFLHHESSDNLHDGVVN